MGKAQNETIKKTVIPDEIVISNISHPGQKMMLDNDLAELYGVETRRLKEQVRRNMHRFPEHFMFELTREEYTEILRSQNATLGHGKHEAENMELGEQQYHLTTLTLTYMVSFSTFTMTDLTLQRFQKNYLLTTKK
ncbi:ORF6N domain-containing protein [Parapedobacter deserti]|uniref:ORF6N domain-containing protein n=1 Tax=Parapedobacter deserti TaxID=1912957 RepID=A0ABV7JHJ2_9SPHI